MKHFQMRSAIAMIELIFAIVIIAISVLAIPSMLSVANSATKMAVIDEDILSRLAGWTVDKSQARWDNNYLASGSPILQLAEENLGCEDRDGTLFRDNGESKIPCIATSPSAIPATGSGTLANGIEQLNGGSETLSISEGGVNYSVTASYDVDYVTAGTGTSVTWTLGSSNTMAPAAVTDTTHLKRIVTRFSNDNLGIDMALTFFKSNKGN